MSAVRRALSASDVSRRGFLALAAGGAGGVALAGATLVGGAAPAAHAAEPVPTLPGEYFRRAGRVSAAGTVYDDVAVRIAGDTARIFVPRGIVPGASTPVVWFYHGARTDAAALGAGFLPDAEAVVDRGVVGICQSAGGTLFSHPTAVGLQVAGAEYLAGVFRITASVLRATSAGGALAHTTYASRLVPNIAGSYHVNSTYDIRALYDDGGVYGAGVGVAFGGDVAAIDAANPARFPASAWAGTKTRIVIAAPSASDTVVPPDEHGLRFAALAQPVAAEASVRTHANGHSTPAFVVSDFGASLDRWGIRDGIPSPDETAPAVRILSPASGATISGVVTARASATDAVGVVDVGFYSGTTRLASATRYSDTEWRVSYDTASGLARNGTFSITAKATDAAGNVGTSAPVRVTIRN